MNDEFYKTPDPWGYKTSAADAHRKKTILAVLAKYGPFQSALDIGCGEGWITQDIPAIELYGLEKSAVAKSRWPKQIIDFKDYEKPVELTLATGVLYPDFDFANLVGLINAYTSRVLVTSHISSRELDLESVFCGCGFTQKHKLEFPYVRPEGAFNQTLRVFIR